jgi:hypothetical protein
VRILAIDPGHTTGWCKIEVEDENPKYVFSGNFDRANINHAMRHLLTTPINSIVLERPPYRLPPIMSTVIGDLILSIGDRVKIDRWISPAEWKPITGRYPLPKLDWRTTQHERDAWRMGVFWLWKEGLIKI